MSTSGLDLSKLQDLVIPPPPGTPYSVALPGSEREGRSKVYRHWRFQNALVETLDPLVRTAYDMFESAANQKPQNPCLGYRPYDRTTKTFGEYQWMNYATVQRRRTDFGAGLVELHRRVGVTKQKYGVGLWCQNRPEWQITDLACVSQSLFSVSIYDTLGPDVAEYIIQHAELVCVSTSLMHLPTLLKIKSRCPTLKLVISLDSLDDGELPGQRKADILGAWATEVGLQIHTIDEVEALGRANPHPHFPPQPDDIVTISYTSGTTSYPKGVILTNANAVASATSARLTVPSSSTTSVYCSYLPLAHIYERALEQQAMWKGSQIGYFHGNMLELLDDFKLLRPTHFASVPRIYNKLGSGLRAATMEQPGVKGALSRHVVSTKLANLESSGTNKHAIYDRIWSRKAAAQLGLDRAAYMVSGSAPLDPYLHQFLRIVFSNYFIQGYGLTESYSVGLAQQPGDISAGNCGAVTPCLEACLMDVPDMEYLHTDQPHARGELLLRGSSLFRGYYRDESETRKAILPDGWFRTGDVCSIDEMGRFTVIDRVKNVLKLAQGEYVSPERIENSYLAQSSWIAQAFVHGDSARDHLVAIFGINPDSFLLFTQKVLAAESGRTTMTSFSSSSIGQVTVHALMQDLRIRRAVLQELDRIGRENHFNGFERVRNCILLLDPFTIENGLLTPTLKLKRYQVAKRYALELEKLYQERDGLETVTPEGGDERTGETATLQDVMKSKL